MNQLVCIGIARVCYFLALIGLGLWSFKLKLFRHLALLLIPNRCFHAYEVKVNKDISKYQGKVKLISQFQRFFHFSMVYESLLHSHKISGKLF